MTARPLADCTLAPAKPASMSSRKSGRNEPTREAASSAAPQPPTPGDEHEPLADPVGDEAPREPG